MFPNNWSVEEIERSIKNAYDQRVYTNKGNIYRGESGYGFEIEMYISSDGRIISAYPRTK